MNSQTFLVTGATGNVGRPVALGLAAKGHRVLAAARDRSRVAAQLGEPVSAVELDFLRPETFASAVQGVQGIFLMRPPALTKMGPTLNALIDAAVQAGVEQVVFLSVIGADQLRFIPHHAVEAHLQASPISWTLLRAGFFAQNLGDAYAKDIRECDRILLPAGSGRAAFLDVRDLAEVAVQILTEPPTQGQALTLTGPEALSFQQVAQELTAVLHRPIAYQPVSPLHYLWHLRRQGLSFGQSLVQTALHVGLRFGQAERVDPTLERLLDRPPRPLRTYIEDHATLWQAQPL
ncbi:MAG: SDR family oxidoreductase [Cyanobacteria bacterium Co-bin13]|nr:SDR family oxidoreductase [Cyanobacteria bacterium Co-bin13]